MSRRYKSGTARAQYALLPPRIEDYVGEDNRVRAIDAYVESLDLVALGFRYADGGLTAGQPSYNPAMMLKLYLAGYMDRVRSSRRLSRECERNLEVIWLVEGLRPGYRSVAEFRRVNGPALRAACRDFVVLCKELELLGGEVVALDGAFFNASASDASIMTKKRLEQKLEQLESDIDTYCRELDLEDEKEREWSDGLSDEPALKEKLERLKAHQARTQSQLKQLEASGESQLSRTDPDARKLSKKGQRVTGYNVQSVVDEKHKLMVHHEVTNAGNDQQQLAPQGRVAKEALGVETLTVLADAGYYSESQLVASDQAGLSVYVPIPDKHKAVTARGRFSGERFTYVEGADVYVCPGGELLRPRGKPSAKGGIQRTRYTRAAGHCQRCPLRALCLPEKARCRQLFRSEHAARVDAHRRRMAEAGSEPMRRRAATVEHPFGTLKRWFGWDHFLVRGFTKVRGEMSLMVLAYNLMRVLNLIGMAALRDYCARRLQAAQHDSWVSAGT